ncbi:MAG: tryptophan synthase subunit alpha [Candidatus Saccharicenans sp.]|uniref:tryptophan synthase subunit alpha n=1 Tax=Candidatus Saccharicenans sp. TaxID=2819258 RepID=UPI00404AD32D
MKMLEAITEEIKKQGQKALVPFFTAFYPTEKAFADLLRTAQASGADLIEIGLPFSDPIADGKYVQHSSEWVLKNGFKLSRFISFFQEFKKELTIPVVIMSYLNPIYRYGFDRFADFMSRENISGILFPDLPVEHLDLLEDYFEKRNISVINMIAPSTEPKRIKLIAKRSKGFIYLVSVYGVTGVRKRISNELSETVARVRHFSDKPLYAGFGISSPLQARKIVRQVDGVIVGSAIIKIIMKREQDFRTSEIEYFLKTMRRAI